MNTNINRQYGLGEMLSILRSSGCVNATSRRLHGFIVDGRLPKPEKDFRGDYAYSGEFVEAARVLLLGLPSARRSINCGNANTLIAGAGVNPSRATSASV